MAIQLPLLSPSKYITVLLFLTTYINHFQILMELRRDYDAIRCCDASIKLNPLWWEAHHTHARALLVFGEPHLALKAFQRALRLNPADEEVWKELHWTRDNTSGSVPTESSDFKKLVKKR